MKKISTVFLQVVIMLTGIAAAGVYIKIIQGKEDGPAGFLVISIVVAITAAIFERISQNTISMNFENT